MATETAAPDPSPEARGIVDFIVISSPLTLSLRGACSPALAAWRVCDVAISPSARDS